MWRTPEGTHERVMLKEWIWLPEVGWQARLGDRPTGGPGPTVPADQLEPIEGQHYHGVRRIKWVPAGDGRLEGWEFIGYSKG